MKAQIISLKSMLKIVQTGDKKANIKDILSSIWMTITPDLIKAVSSNVPLATVER